MDEPTKVTSDRRDIRQFKSCSFLSVAIQYLKDDRLDERVHSWCEGESCSLKIPQNDPTFREDGKQIQHLPTCLLTTFVYAKLCFYLQHTTQTANMTSQIIFLSPVHLRSGITSKRQSRSQIQILADCPPNFLQFGLRTVNHDQWAGAYSNLIKSEQDLQDGFRGSLHCVVDG